MKPALESSMITNGPAATIGEIMEVPFARLHSYEVNQTNKRYGQLRNHALDFLYRRFTHEEN